MEVSIIIVNYNTHELLERCLRSVIAHTKDIKYEIIVVDNGSKDDSYRYLEKVARKKVQVIRNKKNIGFGAANNRGLNIAKGEYILLLNSDTLFTENLLPSLIRVLKKDPSIGIVSCALKNKDGTLQGSGGFFPTLSRVAAWMFFIDDLPLVGALTKPFHPMRSKAASRGSYYSVKRSLDWVTGAFFLMRREVFEQTQGFDEDYFMYTEEVDLCFRAKRLGWNVLYDPETSIIHLGRASSTAEFSVLSEYAGIKLFYQKHYSKASQKLLRLLLKSGAALRVIVFGILEGTKSRKIYEKAYKLA